MFCPALWHVKELTAKTGMEDHDKKVKLRRYLWKN
jgi:hypothetical protein